MGNLLGEPFKDYVNDQIRARQTVHGKTSRTTEEISYLNSKNAWIKLASGTYMEQGRLDLLNENGNPMLDGVIPGSDLAIKNVLFNGLTSFKGKNHNRSQRAGIGTNGAYGVGGTSQHGFSPMPGIISADIKDLNRGSIKKASINIKAHNKNQFDVIDALYLRLGFSIMLEWGVDKYLEGLDSNGNGNVKNMGTTLTDKKFFDWSESSYNTVLPAIEKMREKYNGNYDGMFGVISNFSWTFEADGTYNIKLDIISQGDIIESLKANLPPNSKGEASSSAYQTIRLTGLEKNEAKDKENFFKTLYPGLEDIIDNWWKVAANNLNFPLSTSKADPEKMASAKPLYKTSSSFPNFNVDNYSNQSPKNIDNIKNTPAPLNNPSSKGIKQVVLIAFNKTLELFWYSQFVEAGKDKQFKITLPDSTVEIIPSPNIIGTYSYDAIVQNALFFRENPIIPDGDKIVYSAIPGVGGTNSNKTLGNLPSSALETANKLIFNNITLNDFKEQFYKEMKKRKLAGGSDDPQFKEEEVDNSRKTEEQIADEKELKIYEKGLKSDKGKNKVLAYFYEIRNSTIPTSNYNGSSNTITAIDQPIGVILPDGDFTPPPPPPTIEEIRQFQKENPINIVSSPRRMGLTLPKDFGKLDLGIDDIKI